MIAAEPDANKRQMLQERATTYLERAEEIKRSFIEAYAQQKNEQNSKEHNSNEHNSNEQAEAMGPSTENAVREALKPNVNFKQLCKQIQMLTLESIKDISHQFMQILIRNSFV